MICNAMALCMDLYFDVNRSLFEGDPRFTKSQNTPLSGLIFFLMFIIAFYGN